SYRKATILSSARGEIHDRKSGCGADPPGLLPGDPRNSSQYGRGVQRLQLPLVLVSKGGAQTMDVEAGVREFLRDHVALRDDKEIGRDQSLLDSGLLDSASILELVAFLEERFGIEVADEELVPENFDSIAALVRLVAAKKQAGDAGGDASS
ncbi:MAG TPA: acyl carrier protein, partial [Gaiellaceae bacterium]